MKALRDGQHGYTAATGILPLREAVAADLDRRFGAGVKPNFGDSRWVSQGWERVHQPSKKRCNLLWDRSVVM